MIRKQKIIQAIPYALKKTNFKNFGKRIQGKVRDTYIQKDKRIIITTDRQSAFDKVLGFIPYKGAVLNQISAYWFEVTKNIVPNHIIEIPDPNVSIVKNCKLIPIEMVVRSYITGVTDTSIWGSYEKGERIIYGIKFPDGLKKNQKLPKPVITPTTKAEAGHDERLTEEEILEGKTRLPDGQVIPEKLWKQMKNAALDLFDKGTKVCNSAGIILADTKYEFGIYNGKLMLIDEIHTPDSSRFWVKKTYIERFKKGLEPESFDKEELRIWFKKQGYSGEGRPPKMPDEFIAKMSMLYIGIYEKITGEKFKTFDYPILTSPPKFLRNTQYLKVL